MGIQAGVGMSHHRNPRVAGQEAARQALEQAGVDKPDFVFMFATVGYNQQALLQAVRQATGGAPQRPKRHKPQCRPDHHKRQRSPDQEALV